jgi:hypothetical protein
MCVFPRMSKIGISKQVLLQMVAYFLPQGGMLRLIPSNAYVALDYNLSLKTWGVYESARLISGSSYTPRKIPGEKLETKKKKKKKKKSSWVVVGCFVDNKNVA